MFPILMQANIIIGYPVSTAFVSFPGFYKHIIDTMKRIPFPGNKNGVADNLVEAPHVMLARKSADPIVMPDRFPKSFDDFKFPLHSLHQDTGLSGDDEMFFATRIWQLMTSCQERRENDYECMG